MVESPFARFLLHTPLIISPSYKIAHTRKTWWRKESSTANGVSWSSAVIFLKRGSRGADKWAVLDKAKAGCLWVNTTQSRTEQ
jgi:hypothetical protein